MLDPNVTVYMFAAREYVNRALEIMDAGEHANSDLHYETLRAYNRIVEALRLIEVARQRDEGLNVIEFPMFNERAN